MISLNQISFRWSKRLAIKWYVLYYVIIPPLILKFSHQLVIAENPHNDIREAIKDLLVRCNLSFAAIPYDHEFHNACCDVARSKGYAIDAPSLQPFIPGGVVIATTTYAHLENKSIQIIIALYTAFLIYIDDVHQNDVEGIYGFNERFVLCQPQDDPVLESLASLLRELPKHFGRVSSNMMISSTLNFVTSLILDYETKDMPVRSFLISKGFH